MTSIIPPITTASASGHSARLGRPSNRLVLNSSFFSPSLNLLLPLRKLSSSIPPPAAAVPKISMRLANKQSYICWDCGYIYNERTPFEKLPDTYFNPVCAAPKRRFRVYEPPVNKKSNATGVRKAWKGELRRDEAVGKALPIAVAVGAVALVGLYFYLNSAF